MERMTRNDAAAYLGVDPQTITNWVNKGLLGVFREVQDVVSYRRLA